MKAVVVYARDSAGERAGSRVDEDGVSSRYTAGIASEGSCGLLAYVDEPMTPLQQFFRGISSSRRGGREKDTTSQVMKLGEAPGAWVVLATGPDGGFDVERDAGIVVHDGLHDVFRETSATAVGSRVSSLLCEDTSQAGTSTTRRPEVVYVILSGGSAVLEDVLCHIEVRCLDGAFVVLVTERPGCDIMQIVNRHACSFTPRQSFMFRGSKPIAVRDDLVATVVYRGPRDPPPSSNGRTRVDAVRRLDDVEEVYVEGCGKCVLAERALFEVAYKIGWSEKYGS